MTASDYLYGTTKEIEVFHWADEWINGTVATASEFWGGIAGANITYGETSVNIAGVIANFPHVVPTVAGVPIRLKVKPPVGARLKSITIGYTTVLSTETVDLALYSIHSGGGVPSASVPPISNLGVEGWTQSGILFFSTIQSQELDFSAHNIDIISSSQYLVEVDHSDDLIKVYWLKLILEVDDVESAIGVETV